MATAQQQDPFAHLMGTFSDDKQINSRLDWAAKHCLLVSPATTCHIPAGCSVALSIVKIDPNTETHDVGFGKRSLLRTALLKLANAAGIAWDVRASGRVDPGTDPHYVHWHSEGAWRSLDGTVLPVTGDTQVDLRDGSQQVRKILESSKDAGKAQVQLRDTRAKALEHAQSKSQCRAIRSALAIRTYTMEELASKPFVIARLVFDGRDEDPEMERENKRAVRATMLGGTRALFGPAPTPETARPALPAAMTVRTIPELPPVGSVPVDEDSAPYVESEPVAAAAPPAPAQPTPPAPPAEQSRRRSVQSEQPEANRRSAAQPPPAPPPPPSTAVARMGRQKGEPLSALNDDNLGWYADGIAKSVADPAKARWRADNEAHLAEVRAEQARRQDGGASEQPFDDFNDGGAGQGDDEIPF
jgi:hypothetical protein